MIENVEIKKITEKEEKEEMIALTMTTTELYSKKNKCILFKASEREKAEKYLEEHWKKYIQDLMHAQADLDNDSCFCTHDGFGIIRWNSGECIKWMIVDVVDKF